MSKKQFLFISPHLDDAVLSCGGFINKLKQYGFSVSVLTIFSGSPEGKLSILAKKLHRDWRLPDDAPAERREEDKNALDVLGAKMLHANFLDCIYRKDKNERFIYKRIGQVLRQDAADEAEMVKAITQYLVDLLTQGDWDIVYAPLALGGHVDHHIVREAVLNVRKEIPAITFHFYEDLPYVIDDYRKPQLENEDATLYLCLSDNNDEQKYKAMQAYKSQIKSKDYPSGIDLVKIMAYGAIAGLKGNCLGERMWYAQRS